MFVDTESSSSPPNAMASVREITIVCILFAIVIVFQLYVYLKFDDSEVDADELDKERQEEERRRRSDLLLKALSAF
uniref:Membrane-associated protein n=1 Tax=Angiostrongylus cantonensis TaxID=6313 RepID=A0A0K0DQW3_ANGCA